MASSGWRIFWQTASHFGGECHEFMLDCTSTSPAVMRVSHLSAARAIPNTTKIWLIPEAAPLAVNIAAVAFLAIGGAAYIGAREPFLFLDKDKRRYGDAVYSKYPLPEPKPISRMKEHASL